ncbi:MAG: cytochrome b5 domain-containing protein [Candidatus Paceibacterota bacterium]
MEKKTRLRRMALGILTLGSLLLVYPMLDIGSARRINAQTIDPANMAKHNAPGDCWLAINNKVYNVTNFLSRHSGGASAITPYCGKDATAAFSGKPHPGSDLAALSAYYIGDIGVVPPPPPSPAPQPPPPPEISPVLTKIIISPAIVEMKAGDTELFRATAYDQNNKPMAGVVITYSSSDASVGNIDDGGSFHAQSPGSVLITASSEQTRSTASVTVKENQPLPVPAVSPGPQAVSDTDLLKKRCEEIFGNNEDNDDEDDSEYMEEEKEDEQDDQEDEYGDEERDQPRASRSGERAGGRYVM